MATETRRGTRTATTDEAGPSDPPARRESVVVQLFDGVLRSAATHLCRAEQPLAAEVWASGLMAVWESGPGGGEQQRAFGDALIRHARSEGSPEAMAVLVALGAVAPPRLATKARTAAAGLTRKGVPAPAWAGQVGQAAATEAWIGRDTYGDQEIVIVGFAYPEGGEHSICVLVDHNLGGIAKDAYPGGPLSATLERWQEAESSGIVLAPVTLADAAGRIADALVATDFTAGAGARGGADERFTEMRALLDARVAALPPPARAGQPEIDHDGRERLVADFLSSPEAAGLLAEPSVVMVCHSLVAYRCDYGDGDPLRWSPTLAAVCLLEHFPCRVSLDGPDLAIVPDVVSAWIRFAGRTRGLPGSAVARIADTVETCRDEFTLLMGDETRFNAAKRLTMGLIADGDAGDEAMPGSTAGYAPAAAPVR